MKLIFFLFLTNNLLATDNQELLKIPSLCVPDNTATDEQIQLILNMLEQQSKNTEIDTIMDLKTINRLDNPTDKGFIFTINE